MVTKEQLLRDLASMRNSIDSDETNRLVSYEAWSLVDCAIGQLEDDIDVIMVELEKGDL
jgi:hypothetical protein